jgi:hypothetical protein
MRFVGEDSGAMKAPNTATESFLPQPVMAGTLKVTLSRIDAEPVMDR